MTSQLDGITIRGGIPLQLAHPGKVFWVNNSTTVRKNGVPGSDIGSGTYQRPFATIDYAIGRCTASRGDIIVVGPGHAESVSAAAGIVMDVAGIAIVGLGVGSLRPTITLDTANTASISVTSANMSVYNILFVANFLAVATCFLVTGTDTPTDFTVENCEFKDTSSTLNFLRTVTSNATAANLDGFHFRRNHVHSLSTTAATTAITVTAALARVEIKDNTYLGAVLNSTACLLNTAANNMTDFQIMGNRVNRPSTVVTNQLWNSSSTACTGMVSDNYAWHLGAGTDVMVPTGTKMSFTQNFCMVTGAADKQGLLNPAVEA